MVTKNNKGYIDPSDALYNKKGHWIEFYHIPSKQSVKFKAWITDYTDNFISNWDSEEVYGRMDPIQTFRSTIRTIDLGWQLIAADQEEAEFNLLSSSILLKLLYPSYSNETLKAPPLLKLKFVNLIGEGSSTIAPERRLETLHSEKHPSFISPADKAGLVGTTGGFSFAPDLDAGFFDPGIGTLFPKVINLSCTFTVLHTEKLGFDSNSPTDVFPAQWRGGHNFPFLQKQGTSQALSADDKAGEKEGVLTAHGINLPSAALRVAPNEQYLHSPSRSGMNINSASDRAIAASGLPDRQRKEPTTKTRLESDATTAHNQRLEEL